MCQLSIDEVFWDSSVLVFLLQQTVHAGNHGSFWYAGFCDLVLPSDAQDAAETAHIEALSLCSCLALIVHASLP